MIQPIHIIDIKEWKHFIYSIINFLKWFVFLRWMNNYVFELFQNEGDTFVEYFSSLYMILVVKNM